VKLSVKGILLTGVLAVSANVAMASQQTNPWLEQWYKAKFGRNTPAEEARQKAVRSQSPPQQNPALKVARPTSEQYELWYKAKFGRNSPMEEARQKAAGQP